MAEEFDQLHIVDHPSGLLPTAELQIADADKPINETVPYLS